MSETAAQHTVLVVDDTVGNLTVLSEILRGDYRVKAASNGQKALSIAMSAKPPDIILLDIMMPEMDGYEVCRQLKMDDRTRRIPVIFVTALGEVEDESRGLELGAVDYLTKPISAPVVKARVRTHLRLYDQERHLSELVDERTSELQQSRLDIIWRLARAGEFRDEDTGSHVIRVGLYARLLAQALGLPATQVRQLQVATPLHDIGKIGVPDSVLLKPGKLTDEEWAMIRQHCGIGRAILSEPSAAMRSQLTPSTWQALAQADNPLLEAAAAIADTHHEKWNGRGYPHGLAKQDIPIEGRIVALADVYDALSSSRPYKSAYPEPKVLAILEEGCGEHFDPSVYEVFLQLIDQFRDIRHQYL